MSPTGRSPRERTGYPTQKPLALYERIIRASSREGDVVLDPFAGCATTLVAAQRLDRQWVGMDIWQGAHELVLSRIQETDPLFTLRDITYSTEPPQRTDAGDVAAPYLPSRYQRPAEAWQRISRAQIVSHLAEAQAHQDGVTCGGCGRTLEREFMQLDHITPRSDRGANDITNRILLCQPCNGKKADRYTLRGLTRENKRDGWMKDETLARIAQDSASARAERVRAQMS